MKLKFLQLSQSQLDKLSDISADFGTVMIASVVLPTILGKPQTSLIAAGISLTLFFWLISILLLK